MTIYFIQNALINKGVHESKDGFEMSILELNAFLHAAQNNDRLVVENKEERGPVVQVANQTLKGRVVHFISNIPLLRDIKWIRDYADKLRVENKNAFSAFLLALKNCFNKDEKIVQCIREKMNVEGQVPLNKRSIETMLTMAHRFHGVGMAKKAQIPTAVFRFWPYENRQHLGHASMSLKHPSQPSQDKYFSWGIASPYEMVDRTDVLKSFPADKTSGTYREDKCGQLADRTRKRLEDGERARKIVKKHKGKGHTQLLKQAGFQPRARQKKDKDGDWGVSAQKVYLPIIGKEYSYGKEATLLFGLNEKAICKTWQDVDKGVNDGSLRYRAISTKQNCSAMVARLLMAGGADAFVPYRAPWLYEDPNSLYDYTIRVQEKIDRLNEQYHQIKNTCAQILQDKQLRKQWENLQKVHLKCADFAVDVSNLQFQFDSILNKKHKQDACEKLKNTLKENWQEQNQRISQGFEAYIKAYVPKAEQRLFAPLAKVLASSGPLMEDTGV